MHESLKPSRPNLLEVGVAQIATVAGDLSATFDKHLAMIEEARMAGVDVLLFPELSLTGHAGGEAALDLARERLHPMVAALAEAAGDMYTSFGMIEEGPAAQFYNTVITVQGGEVVFVHRKINLATYGRLEEGKHYARGRYVETCLLERAGPSWRAGLLICADLWNPSLVQLAAAHGATILLAPISSAIEAVDAKFDNPRGWMLALGFYAMVYGMPVVMCNRVGSEDGLSFWGGSCIVDAFGRVMGQAGGTEECLVRATLDYQQVRHARYLLPTVRDANLSLLSREYQRLERIVGVPADVRDLSR